uniref:Chromosome 10 open reading frame 53 n=1 Tax=Astyanax mexicanus TaxID=7994 RepID=A0A3B1K5I3_ASTMX
MPQNSLVIIRYGPYESCGVVEYRTFRLDGLRAALKACGYSPVLEKTPEWNQVELVVNGEIVYKCSIKDLEFGGDGKLDPRCQEATQAVKSAYQQQM